MIHVAISKKQKARGLLARQKFAIGMGKAMGVELRQRVAERGQPVGTFRGYSAKSQRLIAPDYPGAERGKLTPSGARAFASGRDFYAAIGTKRATFKSSGGMWKGLTVRPSGRNANLFFSGRSVGQTPRFQRYKSGAVRAKSRKVSNALKARTVIGVLRNNPIEHTKLEHRQLNQALAFFVTNNFPKQIGLIKDGKPVAGLTALGRRALRNVAR